MPDELLIKVAKEVEGVLKDHDVGGLVILGSKDFSHYLFQLETSWTCFKLQDGMLRIRSKKQDYRNVDEQRRILAWSAGLLLGIVELAHSRADILEEIILRVKQAGVEIDHVSKDEGPVYEGEEWKIHAFDILIKHITSIIPPIPAMKQLAGIPMVEALKDYVFVPKAEWERLTSGSKA